MTENPSSAFTPGRYTPTSMVVPLTCTPTSSRLVDMTRRPRHPEPLPDITIKRRRMKPGGRHGSGHTIAAPPYRGSPSPLGSARTCRPLCTVPRVAPSGALRASSGQSAQGPQHHPAILVPLARQPRDLCSCSRGLSEWSWTGVLPPPRAGLPSRLRRSWGLRHALGVAFSPPDRTGPLWGRLLGGSAAGAPPSCTSDRCLQPHRAPTLGQGQAPKRPHGDPRRTVDRGPVPQPDGPREQLYSCGTAGSGP